jgi:adenylate kinase family enzyme
MTRVSIIGNAGGGKSTLARRLGARLALPAYQVDPLQWLPGWQPAPAEVIGATHSQWLAQPGWVIDGWGS